MRAYIACPRCGCIHGCVYFRKVNNKTRQEIEICFNCPFKDRPCEDTHIKHEVNRLCLNCLIDLTFENLN